MTSYISSSTRAQVTTYALVGIAGMAGVFLRFTLEYTAPSPAIGVFLANVVGCASLGGFLAAYDPSRRRIRAVIGGGFFGSFTTYSALATTTLELSPHWGMLYLVTTYAVGLSGGWLGYRVIRDRGGHR